MNEDRRSPARRQRMSASFGRHRLSYVVQGEGPAIVLVNGLGGGLDMWQPVVDSLSAAGRMTVTYDGPGIGRSTTPLRPRPVSALARITERLLDHLGVERADVLGYSLGGLIAQQLAHSSPSRVRSLTLVATTCGIGSHPPRPLVATNLLLPLRYSSRWVYEKTLPGLVGGRARTDRDLVSRYVSKDEEYRFGMRAFLYQTLAGSTFSSLPWLGSVMIPTLVLAGDDDPIVPLRNARLLAKHLPMAQLHVARGAGHLLLLEDHKSLLPVLLEFLDRHNDPA